VRHIFPVVLLLASLLNEASAGYTNVFFFGDSLTDTGNVNELYKLITPKPPGFPAVIPGDPYDPGGRGSNGPLYADRLAEGLGFDATASLRGGDNYAFGGARTRYERPFGPPFLGIKDQVNAFIAKPGSADSHALYVVWGGANNLQDILLGRTTDLLGNPIPSVTETLGDLASLIHDLYNEGARSFLVPNLPNLGLVPRVRELGPLAQGQAQLLTMVFDAGLSTTLDGLEGTLAGIDIMKFDVSYAFNTILANPLAYGFLNVTDRCYTGDDVTFTGGGTVCANPDTYLFWDGIHPTTRMHQILGDLMLAALPEPSVIALLALGLGLMSVRRRGAWRR
jgi:outer membrane lipase/esterase